MINLQSVMELWLLLWAFIGSTLGYFTIRYSPTWSKGEKIKQYLLSVFVGIFFAFPVYTALNDNSLVSNNLSIMISGSVAFCITDVIIKYWSKIFEGIGSLINKVIDKLIGKI